MNTETTLRRRAKGLLALVKRIEKEVPGCYGSDSIGSASRSISYIRKAKEYLTAAANMLEEEKRNLLPQGNESEHVKAHMR